MHRLPVADLLPQLGVLAPQIVDLLAQFEDFATKLSHQFGQVSRLGSRNRVDESAVHNKNACSQDPASMEGPTDLENGLGEALRPD